MKSCLKRVVRVLLLLALGPLAAQLVGARPATANRNGGDVQQSPQRPAEKPVPAARPQPQVPAAEAAGGQPDQADVDVEKQWNDTRRLLEQQTMERIRSGGANWGFQSFLDDFAPVLAFAAFLGAAVWIIQIILENRRWNKMVKVQAETHAKLLDRFASSQEMLAYVQSEAGKKFLESPVFEGQRRQVSTLPFGRILWSVQIGIVTAFLGAGILFLRGKVGPDADMGFTVFGTLALTLGVGFLVSGGVSYVLAKYFGLLERTHGSPHSV